jgi:hypothetical protein
MSKRSIFVLLLVALVSGSGDRRAAGECATWPSAGDQQLLISIRDAIAARTLNTTGCDGTCHETWAAAEGARLLFEQHPLICCHGTHGTCAGSTALLAAVEKGVTRGKYVVGSVTVDGSIDGAAVFTRVGGSFTDEGFARGSWVVSEGFAPLPANGVWEVTGVTQTTLDVADPANLVPPGPMGGGADQHICRIPILPTVTIQNLTVAGNGAADAVFSRGPGSFLGDGITNGTWVLVQGFAPATNGFWRALNVTHKTFSVQDANVIANGAGGRVSFTPVTVGGLSTNSAGNLVRSDGGSFVADGFAMGQQVAVAGFPAGNGPYIVTSVTATTLTLSTPLTGNLASVRAQRVSYDPPTACYDTLNHQD